MVYGQSSMVFFSLPLSEQKFSPMKQLTSLALISLLFIYSSSVSAQGISKGIEAAFTTSTVKITDIPTIPGKAISAINGDGITGYEGGLFLKFSLAMLYVKPKLLFHYEQGK